MPSVLHLPWPLPLPSQRQQCLPDAMTLQGQLPPASATPHSEGDLCREASRCGLISKNTLRVVSAT